MTIVTVVIKDADGTLELEGRLADPSALDQPPTAALIVGSYLAANTEQICKDALAWFRGMGSAPQDPPTEPVVKAPQLILPDNDVKGYPV